MREEEGYWLKFYALCTGPDRGVLSTHALLKRVYEKTGERGHARVIVLYATMTTTISYESEGEGEGRSFSKLEGSLINF